MFWNDLLGSEYIQTRQSQTRQEHQEGRWGGGQKARKHGHRLLSISNKQTEGQFLLTRRHFPEFDSRHIEATDLGFPIVRLHNTSRYLFQRPFVHTINKQADKHNTRWLEMGMRRWRGWDKWRNVWELMGGSCLCERIVIWKSENMCCLCNVLL